MAYALVLHGNAEKAVRLLRELDRLRIFKALRVLTVDPFIGKKLSGKHAEQYSYRVGSYRIIYEIEKKRLVIIVIDVGQRGGVY
jgi:mRNA interferase RelE/StbE